MLRNLFLVFLLAAFIGLSAVFFYKFNEKKEVQRDYFASIPTQSAWVMEVREPGSLLSTLKGTNIIYDEFSQHQVFQDWLIPFESLDSIISENKLKYEQIVLDRMTLALVPTGADSYDMLVSIQIPDDLPQTSLNQLLSNVLGSATGNTKEYGGAIINQFVSENNFKTYIAQFDGFLLVSSNELAVEDAIRQLNSELSLLSDEEFKRIVATAGNSRKVNWYIQQQEFVKYLSSELSSGYQKNLTRRLNVPSWVELDLWLKPNSLMFNGYSSAGSNKSDFLNVFKGQQPGSTSLDEVLPMNTAFYLNYNISNYQDFISMYQEYLKIHNSHDSFMRNLTMLNDSAGFNTTELLLKSIGSEVSLAILEIQNNVNEEALSAVKDKAICLVRLKNADSWIDDAKAIIKANESDDLFKLEYREVPIYETNINGLISANLGGAFSGLENKYFVVIDDYLVFGEKVPTLREVINSWKGDKTLAEDENYSAFSENLSSTSNITLYSSIARSPYLISYFLKMKNQAWLKDHIELFRKFEGVAIQIAQEEQDLFYYNVYVKHNPIYKKVTSSLWEIPLDTGIASQPQLFINHYSKAGEILIQDLANKVYLISNTGRILWSKKLSGKVMSKFYQVDKFKNDKFQILVNTADRIYLIDRNGKDVSGFPIKLNKKASGPLSLMDYDRNRKYRLLQPVKGGGVMCYDLSGKIVKGWVFKGKSDISEYFQYLSVKNKDYIMAYDGANKLRILNRKGQDRIKLKESIVKGKNSSLKFVKGKSLATTYIVTTDSSGNILKLSLTDKLEVMQFDGHKANHYFTSIDANGDKVRDYVFQNENELTAFDEEGKKIIEIEPDFEIDYKPSFYMSHDRIYISINKKEKMGIELFDQFGNRVDGSPFLGDGKPLIYDINLDNRLEFVSSSSKGMVYCYVLD
ncbi:MAG: DUF3352 domain-containing protein [Salibacteraceae bacterium]